MFKKEAIKMYFLQVFFTSIFFLAVLFGPSIGLSSTTTTQQGMARPILLDELQSFDIDVRKSAIRSFPLSKLNNKEYITLLAQILLEDNVAEVRQEMALYLLNNINELAITEELSSIIAQSATRNTDKKTKELSLKLTKGLGQPKLVNELYSSDVDVRKKTIRSFPISKLKEKKYVDILAQILTEDSVTPLRREVALYLLAHINKLPSTNIIHTLSTQAIRDADSSVRSLAVQGIASFRPKTQKLQSMQTSALLEALSDKNEGVRLQAILGLGQNAHVAQNVSVRHNLLNTARYDIDPKIREQADTVLIQLTGGSSVRPLCERVFSLK